VPPRSPSREPPPRGLPSTLATPGGTARFSRPHDQRGSYHAKVIWQRPMPEPAVAVSFDDGPHVYAESSGHSQIVMSRHNHDHQAVAVPRPVPLNRQVTSPVGVLIGDFSFLE
jgi:hypothetical protein